jgi:GLPGLI family protein
MNIKTFLTGAVVLFSTAVFSQDVKGKVTYDVFVSSDDPATSAYVDQMDNSLLEIYFSEGKVRTNFFMGEMMTTMSTSIEGKDTALVLLDGMMGKIAMKVTENDMGDERRMAMEKKQVELIDGETKEVMGYNCNKAIITGADEEESIVWYTTEIVPSFRKGDYLHEDIPGLPLEMNTKYGKMDLKFVAFEFKNKVKKEDEVFSLEVPEGFTLKTMEEMKQLGR